LSSRKISFHYLQIKGTSTKIFVSMVKNEHIYNYSKLLIYDHTSRQCNQSSLFWILGWFYANLNSFHLNLVSSNLRLIEPHLSNETNFFIQKIKGGKFFPPIYIKKSLIIYKFTPYLTIYIKEYSIFNIKNKFNKLRLLNSFRKGSFFINDSKIENQSFQLISFNTKLINLFYNINPFFLNYFYHIDYTNIFHTYWFSGFLESNLNYLGIYLNKFSYPHLTYKKLIESENLPIDLFETNLPDKYKKNYVSNSVCSLKMFRNQVNPCGFRIFTYVIFEFHLYDKNYYNLLIINKFFKGKILFLNNYYKLILKLPFGLNEILLIIKYLDNFPFITSQFFKYMKLRKIYKICQKKGNYYHKGLLPILQNYN
jgi:hypothetical protein